MIRAFQWDLARQVERLDWLLAQLPRYADWGYNELYLHLEDAVEYPSLPNVARRDAYSYHEMARLVVAADRVGIKVVPIVNLLGHTQYLIKVPALRDLNELRTADGEPMERGQICPVHPRTPEIAEKLLRDMAPFCTAGKVHVGLDESFHLGKHPLSRREISRVGLAEHFARYVHRLNRLTQSIGLRMGMWGDMLYFIPKAVPLLPRDVVVYEWYYYPFTRRPRVELFNFAESDLGEQLTRRGIEYWGCPMNGAFRYEPLPHFTDRLKNITSWWHRCHRLNATGMLITSWEPNRLAMELTTVVDAAAASLWLERERLDPPQMLERGFARVFAGRGSSSRKAKATAKLAIACDKYPFGGYPRWEINSRWDVVSRRESVAVYRRELRHFQRLTQKAAQVGAPQSVQASLKLRKNLAAREVFVREATQGKVPIQFQSTIADGIKAARLMWNGTRDRASRSPNEEILLADSARLKAFESGIPVLGGDWQLCYRVHNFAPAVQLVGVEQQGSDGEWRLTQSCHTIEFQSRAAKPKTNIVREHAAPVEWDGDRTQMPKLRIVARGVGRVRISRITLFDGHSHISVKTHRAFIGKSPRRGFPRFDMTRNADAVRLTLK